VINPVHRLATRRRRPLRPLLLLIALVSAAGWSQENLLTRAAEALRQGDAQTARDLFADAADRGDPVGAYGMGVLLFQGQGVARDPEGSTEWFRRAAEQGYPPAQFNLGNAYLHGRGVAEDPGSAERWWREAARSGYVRAQFNLGTLLLQETDDAERQEQGIAWLRAAAEQGFPMARDKLDAVGEPVRFEVIAIEPQREPLRSEARLLTFRPDSFTIQLFSGRHADSAGRFIERHGLMGRALRFRFRGRDSMWTGVVFGRYDSREEARSVIDGLKPELRELGPWPRPLSEVQQQIRAARADG